MDYLANPIYHSRIFWIPNIRTLSEVTVLLTEFKDFYGRRLALKAISTAVRAKASTHSKTVFSYSVQNFETPFSPGFY